MLGLFLIYFIGKKFYDLAAKYNKHQWGFAIAGVASYYAGTFIAGILIAIYLELWGSTSIEDMNDLTLNFMALPFGVLACFGLYKLLERSWERKPTQSDSDILDEQLPK